MHGGNMYSRIRYMFRICIYTAKHTDRPNHAYRIICSVNIKCKIHMAQLDKESITPFTPQNVCLLLGVYKFTR